MRSNRMMVMSDFHVLVWRPSVSSSGMPSLGPTTLIMVPCGVYSVYVEDIFMNDAGAPVDFS